MRPGGLQDKLGLESERRLTSAAAEKLDRFFDGFAAAARPVLLLDYDGTLAGFRVDRFTARPWAGVRELLQRIQRQGRTGRMAVITGRPAAEIAPMLRLDPPLEVWGLHGAERLYPDGRRELEQAPAATQARLDELREHLKRDSLGGLFEDKANGVVMHWRGASARRTRSSGARGSSSSRSRGWRGWRCWISMPDWSCAWAATRAERSRRFWPKKPRLGGRFPVAYLGDDLSDEAAFRAVNKVGPRGLSVLVRRKWRETTADVRPGRQESCWGFWSGGWGQGIGNRKLKGLASRKAECPDQADEGWWFPRSQKPDLGA